MGNLSKIIVLAETVAIILGFSVFYFSKINSMIDFCKEENLIAGVVFILVYFACVSSVGVMCFVLIQQYAFAVATAIFGILCLEGCRRLGIWLGYD